MKAIIGLIISLVSILVMAITSSLSFIAGIYVGMKVSDPPQEPLRRPRPSGVGQVNYQGAMATHRVALSPAASEALDRKLANSGMDRSAYLEWVLTGKEPEKTATSQETPS